MGARWENTLLGPELVTFAAMALAGLAVGGFVYVLAMPYMSGEHAASKRIDNLGPGQRMERSDAALPQSQSIRKQQIQDTIKDIEARQSTKKRVGLRTRLIRAGLKIKPRTYYLLSAVAGAVGGFVVLVTGSSPVVSLLAAFACAFGLPRWILGRMTQRRQAQFLHQFADAIEIVVRGLKAGLGLSDCMQIIARESPEPVKSEFVDLIDQQKVGVPMSRAFERMYERMPLQEVNFFAIVMATQAQIGGNLAEVLSNLAQVLRDRRRLQGKVKAFSAEAKTSAIIIGALPPLVILAVFLLAPDYISILWHRKLGNLMLIGSAIWMLIGTFIMRKMINFDY
jgi:tight adherence protein B